MKRKKVKAPAKGKDFPVRKPTKRRSETTFFADELCRGRGRPSKIKQWHGGRR